MKARASSITSAVILLLAFSSQGQEKVFPGLMGPYLGQKPPGETPEAFAPSIIVSDNAIHGHIAFSPDGKEIYWIFLTASGSGGQNPPAIQYVRQGNDGRWLKPAILELSREFGVMNFSLSPDGKKLFFVSKEAGTDSGSRRPAGNTLEAFKVWVAERTDGRYLFIYSQGRFFWADAKIIEELRPKG